MTKKKIIDNLCFISLREEKKNRQNSNLHPEHKLTHAGPQRKLTHAGTLAEFNIRYV